MDAVIGVALTATTAGVTLAPGTPALRAAVDGVTVSLDDGRSPGAQLAGAVRRMYTQGAKRGCRARSVAVTWTADADHHAAEFSGRLAGFDMGLLPVPLASAGAALVSSADYADTAVCVMESDVGLGMRGRAVMADSEGLRTVTAPAPGGESVAEWLGAALGELDRQPRRLVLVGGDEQAHSVAKALPDDVQVESEAESILALAHGAALASAAEVTTAARGAARAKRGGARHAWAPPILLAATVAASALIVTMPLGAAGPTMSPVPAPQAPPPAPAPAAVVVAPSSEIPAPAPVVTPTMPPDAPAANLKQNQSDTSAAVPEGRAPQAPPVVVEPVVPAPPPVAEAPNSCVLLCGFVL